MNLVLLFLLTSFYTSTNYCFWDSGWHAYLHLKIPNHFRSLQLFDGKLSFRRNDNMMLSWLQIPVGWRLAVLAWSNRHYLKPFEFQHFIFHLKKETAVFGPQYFLIFLLIQVQFREKINSFFRGPFLVFFIVLQRLCCQCSINFFLCVWSHQWSYLLKNHIKMKVEFYAYFCDVLWFKYFCGDYGGDKKIDQSVSLIFLHIWNPSE